MYKNTFLSAYYRPHGDKIFEIEIASGVSPEVDIELENLKQKYAQWVFEKLILPLKKKKQIDSKEVYYFELLGDFTKIEMKDYRDFSIDIIKNFKQKEKEFQNKLRKELKDE